MYNLHIYYPINDFYITLIYYKEESKELVLKQTLSLGFRDIKPSLQTKDHMQVIKQMMFTMMNVPDQRRENLGPLNSLQKSRAGLSVEGERACRIRREREHLKNNKWSKVRVWGMCQKGLRRVRRLFEPDTDSEPGQVGSEEVVSLSHYKQGTIVSTVEQTA